MDQLTKKWLDATLDSIKSLQKKYNINRGMLLTEGDLECHMFSELMEHESLKGFYSSRINSLRGNLESESNMLTSMIHSQVTWFNTMQYSGHRVDLTICDPQMLEVENIELFEGYPSKGFAYDGPVVAIELKFIRDASHPKQYDEDYIKLRDKLIPDKLENIKQGKYTKSNPENIAFISIVGCKRKDEYEKCKYYLGKHLSNNVKPCPENLLVCVFYQDEIVFDKEELVKYFERNDSKSGWMEIQEG